MSNEQDLREVTYLLEVERLRNRHLRDTVSEVLRHTAKVCREEWSREQVDAYLREQMATTPPLPDKRILAGGAAPIDWHALADQYARDVLGWQVQCARLQAELERLRPVADAAIVWIDAEPKEDGNELEDLIAAVDTYHKQETTR